MESTFYGLPFYRVGLEADPLPEPPNNQVRNGQLVVDIDTDFAQPEQTPSGTLFVDTLAGRDSLIVAPGRPIQPSLSSMSPTSTLWTSPSGTGRTWSDHRVDDVVYDNGSTPSSPHRSRPVGESARGGCRGRWSRMDPTPHITTSVGAGRKRQQLVRCDRSVRIPNRSTQRLDDDHRISVYYSNSTTSPRRPSAATSSVAGGILNIEVPVSDLESSVETRRCARRPEPRVRQPSRGACSHLLTPPAAGRGSWPSNDRRRTSSSSSRHSMERAMSDSRSEQGRELRRCRIGGWSGHTTDRRRPRCRRRRGDRPGSRRVRRIRLDQGERQRNTDRILDQWRTACGAGFRGVVVHDQRARAEHLEGGHEHRSDDNG